MLRQIGAYLVDIQGQNEHQLLLQPEKHLGMLDQYASKQVQPLLTKYQQLYHDYSQLKAAVTKKQANEQQWAQRLDMLHYQVDEIGSAQLKADEEEQLTSERDRLEHFQQINNALQQAVATFNDGEATVIYQFATMM